MSNVDYSLVTTSSNTGDDNSATSPATSCAWWHGATLSQKVSYVFLGAVFVLIPTFVGLDAANVFDGTPAASRETTTTTVLTTTTVTSTSTTNPCTNNPCLNSGTCNLDLAVIDGFQCNCAVGYDGLNCEVNIDDCATGQNCSNRGTCYDGVNSYWCICDAGYTGEDCQTDINECAYNACQNGASCVDQVNGYICECADGYSGTHCSTNVNDCIGAKCNGRGKCTDLINAFSCSCDAGYTGDSCENTTLLWQEFCHVPSTSTEMCNIEYAHATYYPNKSETQITAIVEAFHTSTVTSFQGTFDGAAWFNGSLQNWNVSQSTDFSFMFRDARTFNRDISMWNVEKAQTFHSMFLNAYSFNGNISSWAVSSVRNFRNMFAFANSFNANLGNWDVSGGWIYNNMFLNATSFTGSDLVKWQLCNQSPMEDDDGYGYSVSQINRFTGIFNGAKSLLDTDILWYNATADPQVDEICYTS